MIQKGGRTSQNVRVASDIQAQGATDSTRLDSTNLARWDEQLAAMDASSRSTREAQGKRAYLAEGHGMSRDLYKEFPR